MLSRVKIEKAPDVYSWSVKGKKAYDQKNYAEALKWLRPVLEMENKKPELTRNEWHDVVNWTGISEAGLNNMEGAAKVFNDAIKKNGDYALFSYNLACVRAEQNNNAEALMLLEKALKQRAELDRGRHLPDPQADSSFRGLKNDARFLELLRKYRLSSDK